MRPLSLPNLLIYCTWPLCDLQLSVPIPTNHENARRTHVWNTFFREAKLRLCACRRSNRVEGLRRHLNVVRHVTHQARRQRVSIRVQLRADQCISRSTCGAAAPKSKERSHQLGASRSSDASLNAMPCLYIHPDLQIELKIGPAFGWCWDDSDANVPAAPRTAEILGPPEALRLIERLQLRAPT